MKNLYFILFLISFCANASAQTIISLKTDPLSGQYTTFTVQSLQGDTLDVNGTRYPLEGGCYSFVRTGESYEGLPGETFVFDSLTDGTSEIGGLQVNGDLVPQGIPGVDYFDKFVISQAPFAPNEMSVYFNEVTNTIGMVNGQSFNGYTSNQPDAIELGYGYYLNVGLGGVICQINLPVELESFDVSLIDSYAEVVWVTVSEINTDYFDLQKSHNSVDFTTLGSISAAGSSSDERIYSYIDRELSVGTAYYRLKLVDIDGSFEYSDVISIKSDGTVSDIFPNPTVNDLVNVRFNSTFDHEDAKVIITDMLGRTMMEIPITLFEGSNLVTVDPSRLPAATYVLTIQGSNLRSPAMRFVKLNE